LIKIYLYEGNRVRRKKAKGQGPRRSFEEKGTWQVWILPIEGGKGKRRGTNFDKTLHFLGGICEG
jgi:hypothetical protein